MQMGMYFPHGYPTGNSCYPEQFRYLSGWFVAYVLCVLNR